MPPVFAYIGDIIFTIAAEAGIDAAVVSAIGTILEYAAIAYALNTVEKALNPAPKTGIGAGLEANYYNPEASIRIIIGEIKCGGMQTIPPVTYGTQGEFLAGVLTVAGHQCNAITDCYLDSDQIPSANIGPINTSSDADGVVTSLAPYSNLAWFRRYTGTLTQNVDWILNNEVGASAFSAAFRGRGITYLASSIKFDASVFQAVPQITMTVQGALLYDPRLDSTQPGGSGTQRSNDSTTWTFSKNPALATAWYLMQIFGGEYDPSEIDWPSVMTAATTCDFTLTGSNTTPIGDAKRFSFNGAFLATQGGGGSPFTDNVANMVQAMLGKIVYVNGIWKMFAGQWTTPTYTINKSDWVSGLQVGFEQGRGKRYNAVLCWYISPQGNWQRVQSYQRSNSTYKTADGEEVIELETDQPFCILEAESQRKAEILLRQSRNQVTISGKLPPRFTGINLWDTVMLNFAEFGWTNKTFRVAGCTLNIDGSIDVQLAEEQAGDWADLLTSEYGTPSTSAIPTTRGTTPSSPVSFTVSAINGTVTFDWLPGPILPKGTRYQILSSPFSTSAVASKNVLWQGDATHVVINYDNNATGYVQVQAMANSDFSPYNPNTFGLTVVPGFTPINSATAPASSWVAYFSGGLGGSAHSGLQGRGPLTAVVNTAVAAVYSWTTTSSPSGRISFSPSSNFCFSACSLSPGEIVYGQAVCAIRDTPNSAVLTNNFSMRAQTNNN